MFLCSPSSASLPPPPKKCQWGARGTDWGCRPAPAPAGQRRLRSQRGISGKVAAAKVRVGSETPAGSRACFPVGRRGAVLLPVPAGPPATGQGAGRAPARPPQTGAAPGGSLPAEPTAHPCPGGARSPAQDTEASTPQVTGKPAPVWPTAWDGQVLAGAARRPHLGPEPLAGPARLLSKEVPWLLQALLWLVLCPPPPGAGPCEASSHSLCRAFLAVEHVAGP